MLQPSQSLPTNLSDSSKLSQLLSNWHRSCAIHPFQLSSIWISLHIPSDFDWARPEFGADPTVLSVICTSFQIIYIDSPPLECNQCELATCCIVACGCQFISFIGPIHKLSSPGSCSNSFTVSLFILGFRHLESQLVNSCTGMLKLLYSAPLSTHSLQTYVEVVVDIVLKHSCGCITGGFGVHGQGQHCPQNGATVARHR